MADHPHQRPNTRSNSQNQAKQDAITINAYQQYYQRLHLEFSRPQQSGFVSSSSWTRGDSKYYDYQTVDYDFPGYGREQYNNVSSSDKTTDDSR